MLSNARAVSQLRGRCCPHALTIPATMFARAERANEVIE